MAKVKSHSIINFQKLKIFVPCPDRFQREALWKGKLERDERERQIIEMHMPVRDPPLPTAPSCY